MSVQSVLTPGKSRRPALGNTPVRLEFPARVLVRLLAKGHLHAVEFRCLDLASQHKVRQALLQSCLECLTEEWP